MDREEALRLIGEDLVEQIKVQATAAGTQLVSDLQGVALYASERADHLSLAVGEPGFDQALVAERDNVALKATTAAVDQAAAVDARILAVAQGGLAIAARALAVMATA